MKYSYLNLKVNQIRNKIEIMAKELKEKLEVVFEDPSIPKDVKVKTIINATALACGIVAAQPIPFADIFILSPIQLLMVTYLSKIIGVNSSNTKPKEALVYLITCLGWGVLSQQTIIGLYKTIIPFAGAITTIPLVYMSTYALGIAAKTLLEAKKNNLDISKSELKNIQKETIDNLKISSKGMTVKDAIREFNNIDTKEFMRYKDEISMLESQAEYYKYSEIIDILDKKYKTLKDRYKKYNNISIKDELYTESLVYINRDGLIKFENIIAQLSRGEIEFKNQNRAMQYKEEDLFEVSITKRNNIFIIDSINILEKNAKKYIKKFSGNMHIKNSGIRELLLEALDKGYREIDIASPWISYNVIDHEFKQRIRNALSRGVKLKIRYGMTEPKSYNTYSKSRDNQSDKIAEELKEEFIEYFKRGLFKIKKVNSHYKALICDETFAIEGSFNFLSFKGEYDKNTREEGAIKIKEKDYIKKLREDYFYF